MNDGTWQPGDRVAPDGWSSIKYDSLEQCEERRDTFNRNMAMTEYRDYIKSICETNDPAIPSFKL